MQTIINAIRYVYLRLRYGYGPGDRVITRRLKGNPPLVVGFFDGYFMLRYEYDYVAWGKRAVIVPTAPANIVGRA